MRTFVAISRSCTWISTSFGELKYWYRRFCSLLCLHEGWDFCLATLDVLQRLFITLLYIYCSSLSVAFTCFKPLIDPVRVRLESGLELLRNLVLPVGGLGERPLQFCSLFRWWLRMTTRQVFGLFHRNYRSAPANFSAVDIVSFHCSCITCILVIKLRNSSLAPFV